MQPLHWLPVVRSTWCKTAILPYLIHLIEEGIYFWIRFSLPCDALMLYHSTSFRPPCTAPTTLQHRPTYHALMTSVKMPSKRGILFVKPRTLQATNVVIRRRMLMELSRKGITCLMSCVSTLSWKIKMSRPLSLLPLSFLGTFLFVSCIL